MNELDKSYPYAAASIAVREGGIMSFKRITEIAKSRDAKEAFDAIAEGGYGKSAGEISMYEYDELIRAELKDAYDYIMGMLPKGDLLDFYLLKKDYQNLKVIFKLRLLDKKPSNRYFSEHAREDIEKLKKAAEGKESGISSKIMAEAIKKVNDMLENNPDASLIGLYLDNAYIKELSEIAKKSSDAVLKKYVCTYSDFTNVITYIRLLKAEYADKYFDELFISAGSISKEDIKAYLSGEKKSIALSALADAIKEALAQSTTAPLEIERDNELLKLLKANKGDIFSIAPSLLYLEAKHREADNLRIIMISKLNKKDYSFIQNRLKQMP